MSAPLYLIATLSRWPDTLRRFVVSVREAGETCLIAVAADEGLPAVDLSPWGPIEIVPCPRPHVVCPDGTTRRAFVFARNANVLLQKYADRDVFLSNDDVVLHGSGAPVRFLAETAARPDVGIVSPAVNGACAAVQVDDGSRRVRDAGDEWIFFGAVFLPRRLRDTVGLLDENTSEDVDMTMRSRGAGLRNVVDGRCVVSHVGGGTRLREGT
jgi:hypothetical protein